MAGSSVNRQLVDRRVVAFGSTMRRDAWWVEILPVVLILSLFGIYATFRAFEGKFYAWGPYLSPFYSPLIDPAHHWWRFSPALLILVGPLGFRATCTTIERRTIGHSSCILRPARSAKEAEVHTGARLVFPSSCKTSTAGSFTLLWCFSAFSGGMPFAPSFSRMVSESAWGHSSCLQIFCCSLPTPSRVTRCATWQAESSIASLAPSLGPGATPLGDGSHASMNVTCSSRG